MALGDTRFQRVGESPYPHEQDAVQFIREALPNNDPYQGWALFELPDPSTGRLLEIDALVIGYGALYLIEAKAYPGRISGDATDWWWQPPEAKGRKVWVNPPYRLANLKAKILKDRLRKELRDDRLVPWIQPLVFLSDPEVTIDLRADGRMGVVTRDDFSEAIVRHKFPGSSPSWNNRRIAAPTGQAVARALAKLGIRAREGQVLAGDYKLLELVDEGPGYQDRLAEHQANDKLKARARTYLVPDQTSVERRQQLRRAADRESQLLYEVREHANVLSWLGYVPNAPLGPTIIFDAFEGGQPLPAFLRGETVTFDERVELLEQVARALSFCHRREIFHGGLNPDGILVRRPPGATSGIEVRLHNFQLGGSQDIEATSHLSVLESVPAGVYKAPELREGATRDARSDVFSLGAVAYYLFSERPPAAGLVELYASLQRDRALDIRLVLPDVPDAVADAIDFATQVSLANRVDDVHEWIELLLEHLTEPDLDEPVPDPDPLDAKPEDILGDLMVRGTLGQGATSRVLHVYGGPDKRELALKVSLSPEHDGLLQAEAKALQKMRHARIVQFHGLRTLGGRTCLLIGFAGDRTLKRLIDEEGSVSLDFAARYGDDLLSALEHLEDPDVQVLHRDIKPANLGVGSVGKTAQHLTLFDFSLIDVPRSSLEVGTSVYRDPVLPARGEWDTAADRWSAAVTLHEMLTGVRPGYAAALDPDSELELAAERFDGTVRDTLVAFFERALHRDVERRFDSAKAMRRAWHDTFEAPAKSVDSVHPEPDEALTDAALMAIGPDTPIMALPLSFRARNGLDRAGLLRAADLLSLPDNRLSAVRGVGTKVVQSVLAFRERWVSLTGVDAPQAVEPFDPKFSGDDILVTTVGIDPPLAAALSDAGLRTLSAVARAPKPQVESIAHRAKADVAALRAALARESAGVDERGLPTTLEGLVDALLPLKRKRAGYVRALYGLAGPFTGRLDVTAREVAKHFGKTTANIYLALSALREVWASHGALGDLEDQAAAILSRSGGAIPLSKAADALLASLPHDTTAPLPLLRARAASLLRVAFECQKEDVAGLRIARLGRGQPWLLASQNYTQTLRRLGQAADRLAAREVLASAGQAQREFEHLVIGTPLEGANAAQLAEWAAAASDNAACSALLEIFPRGLPGDRALNLCSGLLQSAAGLKHTGQAGLTVEQVHDKVQARYPAAEPLPPRPKLDELLLALRLEWNDTDQRYHRPGESHPSALGTNFGSRTIVSTVTSASGAVTIRDRPVARVSDVDISVADFDKSLRIALQQKVLRVLSVNPAYAAEASFAIATARGIEAQPLDTLLLRSMRSIAEDKGIDMSVVHAADREGPAGTGWKNLLNLMKLAERHAIEVLKAQSGPLLLTRPGLLARYGLTSLLEALVSYSRTDDADAILLLVPSHHNAGVPLINDRFPIPGLLNAQVLRIPRAFVLPEAA